MILRVWKPHTTWTKAAPWIMGIAVLTALCTGAYTHLCKVQHPPVDEMDRVLALPGMFKDEHRTTGPPAANLDLGKAH